MLPTGPGSGDDAPTRFGDGSSRVDGSAHAAGGERTAGPSDQPTWPPPDAVSDPGVVLGGYLTPSHRDRLVRLAFRLLWNRSDAEDAVQDAWLSALKKPSGLRDRDRAWPWLCGIVVKQCRLRYRRAAAEARAVARLAGRAERRHDKGLPQKGTRRDKGKGHDKGQSHDKQTDREVQTNCEAETAGRQRRAGQEQQGREHADRGQLKTGHEQPNKSEIVGEGEGGPARGHSRPNADVSWGGDLSPIARALRDALPQLPRRQREVLVLRHLEGMEFHDIAQTLGMSVSTARVHAMKGRDCLRERLLRRLPRTAEPGPGEPGPDEPDRGKPDTGA